MILENENKSLNVYLRINFKVKYGKLNPVCKLKASIIKNKPIL